MSLINALKWWKDWFQSLCCPNEPDQQSEARPYDAFNVRLGVILQSHQLLIAPTVIASE